MDAAAVLVVAVGGFIIGMYLTVGYLLVFDGWRSVESESYEDTEGTHMK